MADYRAWQGKGLAPPRVAVNFSQVQGSDRLDGTSPFGHGSDEAVAISLLLRIAAQLVSASADLFSDGRQFAAAAMLGKFAAWKNADPLAGLPP